MSRRRRRRPPRLDLAAARRRGIQDGLLGGNRRWLVLGGAAWLVHGVRWAAQRPDEVVYRTTLQPGESLQVETRAPRRRRTAKRR